jgi:hypothetical protein
VTNGDYDWDLLLDFTEQPTFYTDLDPTRGLVSRVIVVRQIKSKAL